jgi:hypothetical protein
MTSRLLLLASLAPLSLFGQLQIFVYSGSTETTAGSLVNVGSAAPGDTVETRFHVRNTGTGPATLQTLSLSGQGFTLVNSPSLAYVIAPGLFVEFDVNFSPSSVGNYSAAVAVNNANLNLVGTAVPSAILTLAGSSTPLTSGASIDFGSVTAGSIKTLNFVLSNPGTTNINVQKVTAAGAAFSGGASGPISLASGQTASFQITFAPQSGQAAQGTLTVDQRSFTLIGQGMNPPLPAVSMALASTAGASGQQNTISIPLAAASPVGATGTLTLAFQSAVPGITDDPAIQFLSGPKRTATVSIAPGDTTAKFNGQTGIAFQTGTTAGTITFTLVLGNGAPQQARLNITPSPVVLDTVGAVRRVNDLDVSVAGFDNTYSASQLTFTFFDKSAKAIAPGAIVVDATSSFHQYFASSVAGGTFSLLASFPVNGDVTQITGFTLQVANSAGVVSTQTVTF